MPDNTNLQEIIAFFGDTKLNANPNFKKYKEHCPYDPYGVILEYTYRAKLSDISPGLDEVRQAFKEAGRQFKDDIYLLVEVDFLKSNENINVCVSAAPYVFFEGADEMKFCGGKDCPTAINYTGKEIENAEEYLEKMLASENIVKSVAETVRNRS